MNLITKTEIPKGCVRFSHSDMMLLVGSCFSDSIGLKLADAKFNALVNPFGTMYNPASIAELLGRTFGGMCYGEDSDEIFMYEGRWHSWMHHSSLSATTRAGLVENLNAVAGMVRRCLVEGNVLFVTFGSAICYRMKADGKVVANCHKQSEKLFDRVRMSVADIVNLWKGLLDSVFSVNPGLRVVFTVSPIRHKRDGLHVNQLSKSTLLLAVDELCGMYPQCCSYFPSYEILIDELRDYRFYADDLVHPSSLAVEYIWERMCESFLSKETLELMKQLAAVTAALNHKPFNEESAEYAAFMENTLKRINELKNMHPYLNMDAELKICNTKLRK